MARLKKIDWVQAAAARLREDPALSVEAIARDLGVSKGSFYWHFKDRGALIEALLEGWERFATTAIIEDTDRAGGDPGARLWRLIERVFAADLEEDRFEAALRDFVRELPSARAFVERVDARRKAYVANILIEAGVPAPEAERRASLMYAALVGEFTMKSAGYDGCSRETLATLHALMLSLCSAPDESR